MFHTHGIDRSKLTQGTKQAVFYWSWDSLNIKYFVTSYLSYMYENRIPFSQCILNHSDHWKDINGNWHTDSTEIKDAHLKMA